MDSSLDICKQTNKYMTFKLLTISCFNGHAIAVNRFSITQTVPKLSPRSEQFVTKINRDNVHSGNGLAENQYGHKFGIRNQ